MEIKKLYKIFQKHPFVSTDSRKIKKNSIFFALKGENFDGNKYAKAALNSGAALAVISDTKYEIAGKTFVVEDSLSALQELANFHRKCLKFRVLSITGTNGKTTTKELVTNVLSEKFKVVSTQGNFNNHIGVPLTLLSVPAEAEIAVVEFGANHVGEIADLCEIAEPDYGIITNIGEAHLEGFGSLENLIHTKLELFEAVNRKKGIFFLNTNDNILSKNISKANNIIEYGKAKNSIIDIENKYENIKLKLDIRAKNEIFKVNSNLIGDYNSDNILSAIAVGLFFEINIHKIISAIEKYYPANNRSQLKKTENNTLILDMYNANPTSMKLAIENFAMLNIEKKVLIVGDMLELGEKSREEHEKILTLIKKHNFSQVFLIGKYFSECNNNLDNKAFLNVEKLNIYLKNNKISNSHILLKASNGIKLKNCVDFL